MQTSAVETGSPLYRGGTKMRKDSIKTIFVIFQTTDLRIVRFYVRHSAIVLGSVLDPIAIIARLFQDPTPYEKKWKIEENNNHWSSFIAMFTRMVMKIDRLTDWLMDKMKYLLTTQELLNNLFCQIVGMRGNAPKNRIAVSTTKSNRGSKLLLFLACFLKTIVYKWSPHLPKIH